MRAIVLLAVVVALAGCAQEPTEPVRVELSVATQAALAGAVSMMAPGDTLYGLGTDGGYYPIAVKQGPKLPDGVRRVVGAWVVSRGDSFHVYFSKRDELWQVAPPW